MSEILTASRVAELVGGRLEGDGDVQIASVAALNCASAGDITFAVNDKYASQLGACAAAAAIVTKDATVDSASMTLIRVENVQAALATLLGHLAPEEDSPPVGVAATAVVSPDAQLADDVRVGPGVVIASGAKIGRGTALLANVSVGRDVEIGEDCLLCEGVKVRWGCQIANRVRIGPNAVIGFDGFGYYFADGVHNKIPHVGNVRIEDDVEIGACACIDRAKFASTIIGAGTKIDNLVQIAHNVQIGRGCILAAMVGIGGSARIGNYVTLMGHAGVRDNVTIGDRVVCGAYSGITRDVPAGKRMFGIPAIAGNEKMRQLALMSKMGDFFNRLRDFGKRLKALESSKDNQEPR